MRAITDQVGYKLPPQKIPDPHAIRKRKTKAMTLQNIIPAHPFSGLTAIAHRLRENLQERRQAKAAYDRTLAELSAMSGRELADIGINRSDIPRIAAEAAKMN